MGLAADADIFAIILLSRHRHDGRVAGHLAHCCRSIIMAGATMTGVGEAITGGRAHHGYLTVRGYTPSISFLLAMTMAPVLAKMSRCAVTNLFNRGWRNLHLRHFYQKRQFWDKTRWTVLLEARCQRLNRFLRIIWEWYSLSDLRQWEIWKTAILRR